MIRIAIFQAAFEAIARSLPFRSAAFENKITEQGERLIWLEPRVVDRLRALRGRGRELQQRHRTLVRQRRGPHSSARRIGFASRHVGWVRTCARLPPLLKAGARQVRL
jgi:hypothetical protein